MRFHDARINAKRSSWLDQLTIETYEPPLASIPDPLPTGTYFQPTCVNWQTWALVQIATPLSVPS